MAKHFRLKADELCEMRVTVFDMDREDWRAKISGTVQGVFEKLISKTTGLLLSIVDETILIYTKNNKDNIKMLFIGQLDETGCTGTSMVTEQWKDALTSPCSRPQGDVSGSTTGNRRR